jgi:phospholipid N-methyltransferase
MILEHVSQKKGALYLNEITENNPSIIQHLEAFKENDKWGNPLLFDYPETGTISPSTLRYIKILSDLELLFGPLNGLKICEIGVGYGGQCRIINSIYNPDKYTLVDIKPALMLAQRYLDNYILNAVIEYKTMNELDIANYDLIISNYAFTELPRKIQDVYLKKIILNSAKGYITYNEITPDYFRSYKQNELIKMIPNSSIIEEKPLTHEKNCIIAWGQKGNK